MRKKAARKRGNIPKRRAPVVVQGTEFITATDVYAAAKVAKATLGAIAMQDGLFRINNAFSAYLAEEEWTPDAKARAWAKGVHSAATRLLAALGQPLTISGDHEPRQAAVFLGWDHVHSPRRSQRASAGLYDDAERAIRGVHLVRELARHAAAKPGKSHARDDERELIFGLAAGFEMLTGGKATGRYNVHNDAIVGKAIDFICFTLGRFRERLADSDVSGLSKFWANQLRLTIGIESVLQRPARDDDSPQQQRERERARRLVHAKRRLGDLAKDRGAILARLNERRAAILRAEQWRNSALGKYLAH